MTNPPDPESVADLRPYLMIGPWENDPRGDHPGIYIDDPEGGDPRPLCQLARVYRPEELSSALSQAGAAADLRREIQAALGYMMNARIDLETGAPKSTALRTLNGGIERIRATLQAKETK